MTIAASWVAPLAEDIALKQRLAVRKKLHQRALGKAAQVGHRLIFQHRKFKGGRGAAAAAAQLHPVRHRRIDNLPLGAYLKNKDVLRYKNMPASDVVTLIAADNNLQIGEIAPTTYTIPWRSEFNVTLLDMIETALDLELTNKGQMSPPLSGCQNRGIALSGFSPARQSRFWRFQLCCNPPNSP